MPLTVSTHEDHPDPDLRTRFFHAAPGAVFDALAEALEAHHRWNLGDVDRDGDVGTLVTSSKRLLPPVRDRATVTVEPHGEHVARVVASLERSGLGKLRFMARDALKEVLHLADMRFQQAKDSPLRTQGYAEDLEGPRGSGFPDRPR